MSAQAQMNASTADLRRRGFSDADIAANNIPRADRDARAGYAEGIGGGSGGIGGGSGGGGSTASDPVIRAGEDVLGRTIDVDSAEYMELSNLGDYSTITQHLSLSDEARGLGVNPLDWGNTVVDPETLSGEHLEQYEAWSQYNSGPYYSGNQEFMGWVGDRGSLDVYHAEQQGLIRTQHAQTEDGDWVPITTVSQQAVDRFGADNLTFSGSRAGEIIVSPADSIRIGNSDSFDADWVGEGMVAHGTKGNPKKGLGNYISDWTGISENITVPATQVALSSVSPVSFGTAVVGQGLRAGGVNEGAFIADPLGMTSGLAGGSELAVENLQGGASLFNTSDLNNVARAQGYGQAGVQIAASIVNPFLGAAAGSVSAANRAAAGWDSWENAGITAATSFATAGVASRFDLNALQSAGVAGGIQGGATFARGGDASEAFESAAWAAGGSFAGSAVGAAAGFESAAAQGMTSAGVSYGIQGLRTGDWSSADAFANAALSGVGAWGQSTNRQGANDRWRVNDEGGLETSRLTFGERMRGLWSPTGGAINIDAVRDLRANPPRRSSGDVFDPRDAGGDWLPPESQFNPGEGFEVAGGVEERIFA